MHRDWLQRQIKPATDATLKMMGREVDDEQLIVAPFTLADPLVLPQETDPYDDYEADAEEAAPVEQVTPVTPAAATAPERERKDVRRKRKGGRGR